jgi:uncharacterized protein (DUF1501 family)
MRLPGAKRESVPPGEGTARAGFRGGAGGGLLLRRRSLVAGLSCAAVLGGSRLAFADAATERRLVVILLRGALDGLAAVPPYGERSLRDLRGGLVPPAPGSAGGMFDLGGFYGLHPALGGLAGLYRGGELLIVHAVAGADRSRSHFEAQDTLECGADHRLDGGWLNRVVAALPPATTPAGEALAVGVGLPLLLRGAAPAESWLPEGQGAPPPELFARIAALNKDDPILGRALREGLKARDFDASVLAAPGAPPKGQGGGVPALAAQAGRLLAAQDGPRIAALELGGWDTHAGQAGRLVGPLQQLDRTVTGLRAGLGDAWAHSAVLVVTEFGRTVRMNGTDGTDHGTATVAFIAGGAVAGGRVAGTWPGLGPRALFENRDLAPTSDVRAVASGLLAGLYGFTPDRLRQIFPGWSGQTMTGIVRT